MKHINRALGASALTIALVLTGCSATGTPTGSSAPAESSTASGTSQANQADQMFVMMMIPHHEQAIEMSDMVLAMDDVDPRVLDLAQRIKDAQGPEIEQMEAWLDDWGMGMDSGSMGSDGHGSGDHGDGMMSEDDMQALEDATGADASRLYLEQMIEHHEGAVEMAEDAVEDGQHSDVVAFAQQMADAQSAEIAEMEQLLTEL